MLVKTIKYEDYNGETREETFYFNLSKAELTEMELSVHGGYDKYLEKIINTKDTPEMIKIFKELIKKSYGEKSEDGRRFIKSDELTTAFMQTEAYSELYMELALDDKAAAEFVNGILPKQFVDEIANRIDKTTTE